MERNRIGLLAACTFALAMIICGIALAGIQVKEKIGKLTCDGWDLKEKDGQLGLAQGESGKWYVSAPLVWDSSNRYFSGDPEGKSPTLHLVKRTNPHSNLAFTFIEEWKLKEEKANPGCCLTGVSGGVFKMQLSEGPYKNWFVAVDPVPDEARTDKTKTPDWRPLKLVQDEKSAVIFRYHDTKYIHGGK